MWLRLDHPHFGSHSALTQRSNPLPFIKYNERGPLANRWVAGGAYFALLARFYRYLSGGRRGLILPGTYSVVHRKSSTYRIRCTCGYWPTCWALQNFKKHENCRCVLVLQRKLMNLTVFLVTFDESDFTHTAWTTFPLRRATALSGPPDHLCSEISFPRTSNIP